LSFAPHRREVLYFSQKWTCPYGVLSAFPRPGDVGESFPRSFLFLILKILFRRFPSGSGETTDTRSAVCPLSLRPVSHKKLGPLPGGTYAVLNPVFAGIVSLLTCAIRLTSFSVSRGGETVLCSMPCTKAEFQKKFLCMPWTRTFLPFVGSARVSPGTLRLFSPPFGTRVAALPAEPEHPPPSPPGPSSFTRRAHLDERLLRGKRQPWFPPLIAFEARPPSLEG